MPAHFDYERRLPKIQADFHPLAHIKDWITALLVYGYGIPRQDIHVTKTHTENYSRCGLTFVFMQSRVSIDVIDDVVGFQLSGRVFNIDRFELLDTWLNEDKEDPETMLPWFNETITRFRKRFTP